jgi:hypothetical protein
MASEKQIGIDPLSVCSAPIEILCGETVLGHATGFFFRRGDCIHLISNWHVFSGRDPRTGQPKDQKTYLILDTLKVQYHPVSDLKMQIELTIRLISNEGSSIWLQHKKAGQRIDVGAVTLIPPNEESAKALPFAINDGARVDDFWVMTGSDAFVLGYPLGIKKTGLLPVWKRASIATEIKNGRTVCAGATRCSSVFARSHITPGRRRHLGESRTSGDRDRECR